MSNAAKQKKKAAEFEQKKQFDKALQLYIQILEESAGDDEEGDVALYNRVGDLLMRQGNVGDAMTYYEKAVDLYAESGFFNNAIALCNKILRQSPGRNSIYYKLGKISAKKGFISDAKQNFLEYASRMQSGGQLDEAFRALKEFADLCPDQDDIRLMLAEQLSKKDRKGEALEQLQLLYEKFELEGRGADMRETVDRMKAIDPTAEPKTGGTTRSQKSTDLVFLDLSDGEPAKSHKTAKPAPAPSGRAPGGPKHRASGPKARTSGSSRRTSGPAPAAAARVSEPVTSPPPVIDEIPMIVDASLDSPSLDASDDEFGPGRGMDGGAGPVSGLMSAEAVSPDEVPSAETLQGFETSALDSDLSVAFGETLPGLPGMEPPMSGEEFASLRLATPLHVPVIEPPEHDLALPGELPPLGGATSPNVSFTGEMELIIPDDDADFSPRAPASPGRGRPSGAAGSAEEGRARRGGGGGPRRDPGADIDLPMLDVDLGEPEIRRSGAVNRADFDRVPLVSGADLLNVSDAESDAESDADEAAEPDDEAGPTARGAAVTPEDVDPVEFVANAMAAEEGDNAGSPVQAEAGDADGIDLPDWMDESSRAPARAPRRSGQGAAVTRSEVAGPAAETPHRQAHSRLARAAESWRARAEASPTDWGIRRQLAEALFEDGDREGGLRELEVAMIGLERSQDLDGARSMADEIIRLNPNSVRHHQKRVEYAFRTNDRSRLPEAYLELADALFRSGQADKARAVYQRVLELAPDDPRAQAALSTFGDLPLEPPLALPEAPASTRKSAPAAGARSSAPRLRASGPRRATRDSGSAGAPSAKAGDADRFVNLGDWLRDEEAPKSTRLVVDDEEPTGDQEADFADMLRRFKRGIAENVSDEDHESHYDLGVAYKEMGLVDEAIAEFQKALRGPSHRVRTYEALGQCFIEKQQFQVAATILGRALNEPGVSDDQLVGVLYLLGYTCEALMRWEAAIGYYQRVFAVDIQFRDTAQRLTMLERAPR